MSGKNLPLGAVRLEGLTWIPEGQQTPVLHEVDLQIDPGERVLLIGPSGAGKSTLLHAIAGVLGEVDPGVLHGSLQRGGNVGLLTQDPADALVAATVGRDVAFGCENAAMPRSDIHVAVREALELVGFPYPTSRSTLALSGGEAQRLALAGVIAPRPEVLLLDEPTACLDEESSAVVRDAVDQSVSARGSTLIVVEHRIEPWLPLVDRVLVMGAEGSLVSDFPVSHVDTCREMLSSLGVWVPGVSDPAPLPLPEGLFVAGHVERKRPAFGDVLMVAEQVEWLRTPPRSLTRTRRAPVQVLTSTDACVRAGEVLGIQGRSGAGKSSFLRLLAGLAAPTSGSVRATSALFGEGFMGSSSPAEWSSRVLAARVSWVPQRSSQTVVADTVWDSLVATARVLGLVGVEQRGEQVAEALSLGHVLGRNPHSLSGGEKRRLAVASAVLHGPGFVALDEPTVGQDRGTWAAVAGVMSVMCQVGAGVVVASHDRSLCGSSGLVDSTVEVS
ncbi:Putative HMP/thiamine import ATP-binding protein YkoD [Dermatophilus congolensis]|uniref:HMP/thiamine import ATP-binding protein YkoD n=1 Tax=Dermatophilus congolensis TaxID=1863 RepID=A0AA46BLX6_9MICO|nr:ATP-binding cassette domain-containing protein [Dermatophilus congolensis]STD05928.1 Putative HMP/thiamine import ATP-binding protein YkoD [Dermatophilus congolensis]